MITGLEGSEDSHRHWFAHLILSPDLQEIPLPTYVEIAA